jgi:hypothetical protein
MFPLCSWNNWHVDASDTPYSPLVKGIRVSLPKKKKKVLEYGSAWRGSESDLLMFDHI